MFAHLRNSRKYETIAGLQEPLALGWALLLSTSLFGIVRNLFELLG